MTPNTLIIVLDNVQRHRKLSKVYQEGTLYIGKYDKARIDDQAALNHAVG